MKFKPGDKVSFLNEKRDGIVKKVLGNKMVLVEIEDGFEIPVIETDLVNSNPFEAKISENAAAASINEPEPEERFPERFELNVSANEGKRLGKGFYLAFIPELEQQYIDGNFAIYLLNNTEHAALFTYAQLENGKFICKDFDRIDEGTALLLSMVDKSSFEKWSNLKFQFILFRKGQELNTEPDTLEIKIRLVRFYKEDNFSFLPALNEKCFLIPFDEKEKPGHEANLPEMKATSETEWKNEKILKSPGIKIVGHINDLNKIHPFPEKHLLENGIAEVDLHIEELVDDLTKVKSHEIIFTQMNYFIKMLDSAIENKLKKIIFIHGVGNGMLKQKIIEKLKNNYTDLVYTDASILRYGKGATEVVLHPNLS